MPVCMRGQSFQSCLTLCDPMDCSPPGSSVHLILQARILERLAMPSSRGSSPTRDQTRISCVFCLTGGFFTTKSPGKPAVIPTGSLTFNSKPDPEKYCLMSYLLSEPPVHSSFFHRKYLCLRTNKIKAYRLLLVKLESETFFLDPFLSLWPLDFYRDPPRLSSYFWPWLAMCCVVFFFKSFVVELGRPGFKLTSLSFSSLIWKTGII